MSWRGRSALKAATALGAATFVGLGYLYIGLPDVRFLADSNPTTTAFMELRKREAEAEGLALTHEHRWVPYSQISQHLKRAVIVAEDAAFFEHEGIDFVEIRKSIEVSLEKGTAPRGASTITQQLAKNLYLSPSRDPFRKLRELIITRRLEAALSKVRIFEVYLNVIEWGDGVWGAEAAAHRYFGVPASALNPDQAALLAGAIVNARALDPASPNRRLLARQRMIRARMGKVSPPAASQQELPSVTVPAPASEVPQEPIATEPAPSSEVPQEPIATETDPETRAPVDDVPVLQ